MIVAMEISKWLNDYPTYLQCVVQTYGLIAPIVQADIDSEPVLKVNHIRISYCLLHKRTQDYYVNISF